MAMELEDEDLNKCRDLVAADDGCDLARKRETALLSKKSEVMRRRRERERRITKDDDTDDGDRIDVGNTCVWEADKKKETGGKKDWHCVVRVCTKIARDREPLQKEGFVASRVIRRRHVVLSTDECNFSRMLRGRKSAGNRKRNRRIRVTRERETKLQPDARLARVFASKNARSYLTHDGERLMPFDESRCPSMRCRV